MNRRKAITILGGAAAAWPLTARAQQPAKLPTIGFLGAGTPLTWKPWVAAFEQRLRELGWVNNHTFALVYRWAVPTGGAPGICPAVSERPVVTPRGLRRVGRTTPLAPDWVARDRREKSGRAGQGYPAARRDGRRPASLVTRRGGAHRRVAACGSKGSEPGHERGHNAQRPAAPGQARLATTGVVLPRRVLSVRRSREPAAG